MERSDYEKYRTLSTLLYMASPLAYLITFTCYGSHLHGDERGSVDPKHNLFGGHSVEPDSQRRRKAQRAMTDEFYVLDASRRATVLGRFEMSALTAGGRSKPRTSGATTFTSS